MTPRAIASPSHTPSPTTQSFDTNGDGKVSPEEFEANLFPKTRKKIEEKLNMGWKFDHAKWAKSMSRHQKWDMSLVFKQFDADGACPHATCHMRYMRMHMPHAHADACPPAPCPRPCSMSTCMRGGVHIFAR